MPASADAGSQSNCHRQSCTGTRHRTEHAGLQPHCLAIARDPLDQSGHGAPLLAQLLTHLSALALHEKVVYDMAPGGDQRKWPHMRMTPWGDTPTLQREPTSRCARRLRSRRFRWLPRRWMSALNTFMPFSNAGKPGRALAVPTVMATAGLTNLCTWGANHERQTRGTPFPQYKQPKALVLYA